MIFLQKNYKKELQKLLSSKKFYRIFILTGKNSFYKSKANTIFENLLKDKICLFYFKQNYLPEIKELQKIILSINKFKPDLIIAIGGGAVLDYAKSANVLHKSKKIKNLILNSLFDFKKNYCKLLAIPTTAGSGAEVTSNSVIYIKDIKHSIEHENLKPDFFFLIPELIIKSSIVIKSSAGFDAISQAVESLISKKSNGDSIKFSEQSLKLSLNNYIHYLNKPNKENSFKMLLAANLSGKAISITKTTAPHAVSYPFSSIFGIPHGHAVSLTLSKFLDFNYLNIKNSETEFDLQKRFNLLFKIFKVKNINELILSFDNLKKKAFLDQKLKKFGIDIQRDYSKILSGINLKRLKNNPINVDENDIKKILLSLK